MDKQDAQDNERKFYLCLVGFKKSCISCPFMLKIIRYPLQVLMKSIWIVLFVVTCHAGIVVSNGGSNTGFRDFHFLDIPAGTAEGTVWRIVDGVLQKSKDGEKTWEVDRGISVLNDMLKGGWSVGVVLGAPVLYRNSIKLDIHLTGMTMVKNCLLDDTVIEVGEQIVSDPNNNKDVAPKLSVFRLDLSTQKPILLSSFIVPSDDFGFHLKEVFAINDKLMAITLFSRHPGVNRLVFYDLELRKELGFMTYSFLQYLPLKKSFWLTDPFPKSLNIEEMIENIKKRGRIIPIYNGNKINVGNFQSLGTVKHN